VLTEISTVTGVNNLVVLSLQRWFGVVDSSCWFVDVHCRWFQISSEEPVLTEILTVTGANNLIVLGLRFFSTRSSPVGYLDVFRLYIN
jgi:hypothetical protein